MGFQLRLLIEVYIPFLFLELTGHLKATGDLGLSSHMVLGLGLSHLNPALSLLWTTSNQITLFRGARNQRRSAFPYPPIPALGGHIVGTQQICLAECISH